jgi:hypothetical protein
MALTKEDLAHAFHDLGRLAFAEGKVIDLVVYGGSALMLVSNFRESSWDIDAVARSEQDFVDRAAKIIAAQRGWSRDWLNDGVRTYLSPLADEDASHELFATYPNESSPGLRVYVPTPQYMLAMKLMALRIEAVGGKDFDDILNLMRVVGITSPEQIVDLAAQFYPEAKISGKLRLALDDIWKAYQAKRKRSDDEAPQYLGRSGPPSKG